MEDVVKTNEEYENTIAEANLLISDALKIKTSTEDLKDQMFQTVVSFFEFESQVDGAQSKTLELVADLS